MARFRSTLGRLSWLAMTRVDLVYYVSMLARGQATPPYGAQVLERCQWVSPSDGGPG